MKTQFENGDEAYILDEKVNVTKVLDDCAYTTIGWCPLSVLSFTPYTASGITHERPKPKPAGMFWDDDDKECGSYGVLVTTQDGEYACVDDTRTAWRNFQEMTFEEYRELKGI